MKLAIISHTEHYRSQDGNIVGWGPTITEINQLAKDYDEIYHIAFLHRETPPPSSLPYVASNVIFVPLQPLGGHSLFKKLQTIWSIPKVLRTVHKVLKKVDVFQLRTPTGIGVYLIPYLTMFSNKRGWYKYAGNWVQKKPPLGYAIQRWLLKQQSRTVTVNGKWEHDKQHIVPFENPCLTLAERAEGKQIIENRRYLGPFTLCFVGRLENAKGVQRIIDVLTTLEDTKAIATVHFIGNGTKTDDYKNQLKKSKVPTFFHGFLARNEVFEIYKKSQFFWLPSSASEGFPKVIAEAMNFGCIPIVSTVSSIGQYITTDVGFPIKSIEISELTGKMSSILMSSEEELKEKSNKGYHVAETFTFEYYRKRIKTEILN